jgi:hypothetical protein
LASSRKALLQAGLVHLRTHSLADIFGSGRIRFAWPNRQSRILPTNPKDTTGGLHPNHSIYMGIVGIVNIKYYFVDVADSKRGWLEI